MVNDHKLGGLGYLLLVHSSTQQVGLTGALGRVLQGKKEGVGTLGSQLEALGKNLLPGPTGYWQN